LTEFSKFNSFYTIDTGIVGEVTAESEDDVDMEIIQAKNPGESAFINVKSKSTRMEASYVVSFEEKVPDEYAHMTSNYEIKGVKASDAPEAENTPENTVDGDLSTRWSAENEQSIEWDLGEIREIDTIMLAFMNGNTRTSNFNLEISEDGQTYKQVFDGESSGQTSDFERFSFALSKARYIKFNGHGNSVNLWNSITEIQIPEKLPSFGDLNGHWANDDILLFASVGLVKGVGDNLFDPDGQVTRAEFTAMVTRLLKIPEKAYNGEFGDVSDGDWYAGVLSAAVSEGLIPGEMYADGGIKPNAPVTREEAASIIIKAYEQQTGKETPVYGLSKFTDADEIAEFAKPYIEKGLTLRIFKGVTENTFNPKGAATRAEAVVMVKRLFIKII
jgi:hypothetical protein